MGKSKDSEEALVNLEDAKTSTPNPTADTPLDKDITPADPIVPGPAVDVPDPLPVQSRATIMGPKRHVQRQVEMHKQNEGVSERISDQNARDEAVKNKTGDTVAPVLPA